MRRSAFVASLSVLALTLSAPAIGKRARPAPDAAVPAAPSAPATRPRLIVAIAVDQYSADLFSEYRRRYEHGLARLQQGAVFPQGYQSHAATETCPGHSTILTGVHPARTGVIANEWFDPASTRPDKRIYCAEDETNPASSARDPVVSAGHLLAPTLGDRLKALDPRSRNVAVSAKDRAVMMMGGHTIDAAYWWKNGAFTTLVGRPLSPSALAVNAGIAATRAAGAPAFTPPAWCASHEGTLPVGTFSVGDYRYALAPGAPPEAFRTSPRMDIVTGDLALRLVEELKLGQGPATDVLSVSFSATDIVGHAFGTEGLEMCIEQAELDRAVGRLLDGLDRRGVDYVVVLTADHGGFDAPERLDRQAVPSAVRAAMALTPVELAPRIAAATGVTSPSGALLYGNGAGGDYYVANDIAPAQRARVIASLATTLRADPQVALALTADELAALPIPTGSPQDYSLTDRARASFHRGRSGDVVALLRRGVVGVPEARPGIIATHGSPWDYDRRVPMLFWRKGLPGFEQPAPVETVDIAPTLAALIGLKVPSGQFDGRCLDLDPGAPDTCQGAGQ